MTTEAHMHVKLILVSPKYQINLGYIARVAKNFGIEKLHIVDPRAKVTGSTAIKYSKHARDLLEGAKTYKTLGEATAGCDFVLGTTGIWDKAKKRFNNAYLAEHAAYRLRKKAVLRGKKFTVALLIGRDDIGLTAHEIEQCDAVAFIQTNPKYPVLNISHALAILLYEFTKKGFETNYLQAGREKTSSDRKQMEVLFKTFEKLASTKKIRHKKSVNNAFRKIINEANPSMQEIHAIITALK